MTITQRIRTWLAQSDSCHAGCIHETDNPLLAHLVRPVLSRVNCADTLVAPVKERAASGTVVYALKHPSQIDSLILRELSLRKGIPRPVFAFDISMLAWQPLPSTAGVLAKAVRRLFSRPKNAEGQAERLKRIVRGGESAIIHLGVSEFFDSPRAEEALGALVESAGDEAPPLFIVPVLVAYGRRREKENESIFNILFGQTEHTGIVRRIITFLRYANQAVVIFAEPVEVRSFIAARSGAPPPDIVHDLRRELIERIDEEKTTTIGPTLKSRDEIMNMVMGNPRLEATIRDIAAERKTGEESVRKEARKYLDEIAAGYNDLLVGIWFRFLTYLWNNIYDGMVVDEEGMTRLRNLSRRMPFVIVPCHRSHTDYLILSYMFFTHNIQMPFVAAGINMAFWPFGTFFRKSGAFFLRRTFRGNLLYAEVMTRYIHTLLAEGLPIEFFIEGGRSRTGKMVMPKYGLLSMIIQAYRDGACDDLAIVPVFIGYDRIIEEKSYLKELSGGQKSAEKATDVLKSRKVLKRRYGSVYVNIGDPILLKSYLSAQPAPFERISTTERQSLYRKIGYELVLNINKVSVVTPFAMVASGLLAGDRRGISHEELLGVLEAFYDFLAFRRVRFAATLSQREKAFAHALHLYEQSGLIARIGEEEDATEESEEVVYSLGDEQRLSIEYYKNNILHYFLHIGFVAASMLSFPEDVLPGEQVRDDYGFLKRLLWHEFIFDETVTDEAAVADVLSYLEQRDWVVPRERDGRPVLEITGRGRRFLAPFAGLLHNYIESHWVVLRSFRDLRKGPLPERDWLRRIHRQGQKMLQKGEIRRAESLSQPKYQSAIAFLAEAGSLSVADPADAKERKEGKTISLGEERAATESLRRRLFRLLP